MLVFVRNYQGEAVITAAYGASVQSSRVSQYLPVQFKWDKKPPTIRRWVEISWRTPLVLEMVHHAEDVVIRGRADVAVAQDSNKVGR